MTVHIAVEGPNDRHIVGRLIPETWTDSNVEVKDYGGIDELLIGVKAMPDIEEVRVIAIVVDANDHPDRRWQAVRDRLVKLGADVPTTPVQDGTIIPETDTLPRIGIWVMPDNKHRGELEHFVAAMIPDDDPVWPLAEAYVDGIPQEHREFRPQKETRAKVLSWIATREEPGFMGQAVQRGDLRTDGELCQRFIAWLDRLFAAEAGATEPA